jgi:hypothetical protein
MPPFPSWKTTRYAYARVKMMSARQAVGPSADETATNLATRPEGSAARLRFTKDWSLEEIIPAPKKHQKLPVVPTPRKGLLLPVTLAP